MENLMTPSTTTLAKRSNFSITRVIAGVLLIGAALIIGFFAGNWYNDQSSNFITPEIANTSSKEQDSAAENVAAEVDIPSNSLYVSARTGIFKGYLTRKEVSSSMPETCDVFVVTEGDLSIFYETQPDGRLLPLPQHRLPFDLVIDMDGLPVMTQEALENSSASTPIVAAITEYVSRAGKGGDACSSQIDEFRVL